MGISEHTKLEIAKQQLFLATDLYLEGKELVAAITLAGAAEEILRSMVKNNNGVPAIEGTIDLLEDIFRVYEAAIGGEPRTTESMRKTVWNHVFEAKVESKHYAKGKNLRADLDHVAHRYLVCAISDYKKVKPAVDLEYEEKFKRVELTFIDRSKV